MQAIERINLPKPDTHCFDDDTKSDVWSYSRELVISTVLAHIDKLEAEIHASDLAAPATVPEQEVSIKQVDANNYCLILRLLGMEEEGDPVAEIERLRKDAERYRWLAKYLVSDDESHNDAIVAVTTVAELDYVIDAAMKGTP